MKLYKNFILFTLIFVYGCGSSDQSNSNTQYYKKQETQTQQLELSIEASGIIEAISSVEIKSKASGEILFKQYLTRSFRFNFYRRNGFNNT